jgi:hypothetical protein
MEEFMSEEKKQENKEEKIKYANLFEAIELMKKRKLFKRKDWGRGKHLKYEKGVIYFSNGRKFRNSDNEIVYKYDIWENTQIELLTSDYVEFKED